MIIFDSYSEAIRYLSFLLNKSIKIKNKKEFSNEGDYLNYAKKLIKENKEINKEIERNISKNTNDSFYFAECLLSLDKEIPKKIEMSISKDPELSFWYGIQLIKFDKEISDNILNSIMFNKFNTKCFIETLKKNNIKMPKKLKNL